MTIPQVIALWWIDDDRIEKYYLHRKCLSRSLSTWGQNVNTLILPIGLAVRSIVTNKCLFRTFWRLNMTVDWFWIVGWFVTLFGLLGNSWIIFIIVKTRRLQTRANWFVLSLAIADLSVTCGYFPASFVCNVLVRSCSASLRFNFHSSFIEASTFALIAMISERYIAVVYSLK